MQSVIQRRSYGSVRVFWLDREQLDRNIRKVVEILAAERPEVTRIILFGSVASRTATPSSDVDMLLIVREARARFIDRALPYTDYFAGIGLGTDLFVYTEEEVSARAIPLLNTALKSGNVLFVRDA